MPAILPSWPVWGTVRRDCVSVLWWERSVLLALPRWWRWVPLVLLWRLRPVRRPKTQASWVCIGLVVTAWVVYSSFTFPMRCRVSPMFEGGHCLPTRINLENYSGRMQFSRRNALLSLVLYLHDIYHPGMFCSAVYVVKSKVETSGVPLQLLECFTFCHKCCCYIGFCYKNSNKFNLLIWCCV